MIANTHLRHFKSRRFDLVPLVTSAYCIACLHGHVTKDFRDVIAVWHHTEECKYSKLFYLIENVRYRTKKTFYYFAPFFLSSFFLPSFFLSLFFPVFPFPFLLLHPLRLSFFFASLLFLHYFALFLNIQYSGLPSTHASCSLLSNSFSFHPSIPERVVQRWPTVPPLLHLYIYNETEYSCHINESHLPLMMCLTFLSLSLSPPVSRFSPRISLSLFSCVLALGDSHPCVRGGTDRSAEVLSTEFKVSRCMF